MYALICKVDENTNLAHCCNPADPVSSSALDPKFIIEYDSRFVPTVGLTYRFMPSVKWINDCLVHGIIYDYTPLERI